MTTRHLLILLTFFISEYSFGQAISKSDILKFKIKTVKTIDGEGKIEKIEFFDTKGNLHKEGSMGEDNKIQINKEYIYDKNEGLVERRTFDFKGDIHTTTKHLYDNQNRLVKSEISKFGDIDATWTFEYDKNGNKIKETQISGTMGNSVTHFKYNLENLLIQEDKTNNSIGREERVNYSYNPAKQLTEKKTLSYYFNTTIKLTYTYNDKGNLIKLLENSSNGVFSTKTYLYNDKNLLISDSWTGSIGKMTHKTTYEISYE
jgi:hypothetical protein